MCRYLLSVLYVCLYTHTYMEYDDKKKFAISFRVDKIAVIFTTTINRNAIQSVM